MPVVKFVKETKEIQVPQGANLRKEALKAGNLTGALGQQPFLQGFWPVMQLYLQIDRGISAANLDTRAQLVTQDNVENVGKRFEN